jgi:hypothetical protein
VYPVPAVSTTICDTLSPLRIALAVAPDPPPPLKVTVGSLVYPEPLEVTVMAVTKPAVTVATAVAVSPAKQRHAMSQTSETSAVMWAEFIFGMRKNSGSQKTSAGPNQGAIA